MKQKEMNTYSDNIENQCFVLRLRLVKLQVDIIYEDGFCAEGDVMQHDMIITDYSEFDHNP